MKVHQLIKLLSNYHPNDSVMIVAGNIATGEDETNDCDFFNEMPGQIVLASSMQCCSCEANIESETV